METHVTFKAHLSESNDLRDAERCASAASMDSRLDLRYLEQSYRAWKKGKRPSLWSEIAEVLGSRQNIENELRHAAVQIVNDNVAVISGAAGDLIEPLKKTAQVDVSETANTAIDVLIHLALHHAGASKKATATLIHLAGAQSVPAARIKRVITSVKGAHPAFAHRMKKALVQRSETLGKSITTQTASADDDKFSPATSEQIASLFESESSIWHLGKRFRNLKVSGSAEKLPLPSGKLIAFGFHEVAFASALELAVPKGDAEVRIARVRTPSVLGAQNTIKLIELSFGTGRVSDWQSLRKTVSITGFCLADLKAYRSLEKANQAIEGVLDQALEIAIDGKIGPELDNVKLPSPLWLMDSWGQNNVRFHVGRTSNRSVTKVILETEFAAND